MCKVIDSEIILKSYFKKYPRRSVITYKQLKQIRLNAEPQLANTYLDVTYSSLRSVVMSNPDSIVLESKGVRVTQKSFKELEIPNSSAVLALSGLL